MEATVPATAPAELAGAAVDPPALDAPALDPAGLATAPGELADAAPALLVDGLVVLLADEHAVNSVSAATPMIAIGARNLARKLGR